MRHVSVFVVDGKSVQFYVENQSASELCQWIEHLRCRSGSEIVRLRKTWHTDTPSVQGIWTPFTHLSSRTAVTSLPNDSLSRCFASDSASDYLSKLLEDINIADQKNIASIERK